MPSPSRFILISLTLLTFLCVCSRATVGQPPPQSQPVDNHRAELLREVEELKQKITANPNDASTHFKLGNLYQGLAMWQEAVAAYERATQTTERFATAYYALGWCYGHMMKHEEALKAHQQALLYAAGENSKLEKEAAQYAIGWDHYRLKQYPEALEAYLRALEINPKYQVALYEIGRVYIAREQREKVLPIAQQLDSQYRQLLLKELELLLPLPMEASPSQVNALNQPAISATAAPNTVEAQTQTVSPTMRPIVTTRDKAKYTEIARQNRIYGVVVLSVIFAADGTLNRARVLRPLPFGLTGQALLAVEKIRFTPALKDGQPVSVRGNLEYSFSLY
jgi:TonB family protein